ncbi:MAG: family 78 glycoside hydrolase catalytic domain [Pseudomonadales bacterium]
MGIHSLRPRLSWWTNDPRPAELQSAFQIQAASTPALLRSDNPDLWDSGHVPGQQTVNVEYAGRPLCSGSRVWWRVRCFDSDGIASAWSEAARFELGLLLPEDWQASWIGSPLRGTPTTAVPAPLLWRDFDLDRAPEVARLYVAVLGAALWEINGRPATEHEPVAAWTDLTQRVPYHVYDVTALLVPGSNRLGALLSDGDYCGRVAGGRRQQLGEQPALCAQLVLEGGAGERQVIVSDDRWRWSTSWLLSADRDAGEEVDGRQWLPRWSMPGPEPLGYAATAVAGIELERHSPCSPPVSVRAEHEAIAEPVRSRTRDGRVRLRYDFGRSLLGRVRIRLRAPAGVSLAVRYGDAAPAAADTRWAEAVDRYTTRGQGREVFQPRFALHAFRFVEISSRLDSHEIDQVCALEVAACVGDVASLRCDHRLLEQLFEVAQRTCRMGLSMGPVIGLDAGSRLADAADAEAIQAGAGACVEAAPVFGAWARTLRDGRPTSGAIEASLLPVLWYAYRCYGDRRLLESSFSAVQRHMSVRHEQCLALLRPAPDAAGGVADQLREVAGYCYALGLATRMAGVLGQLGELQRYDNLARRLRQAFRARFVTPDGLLAADDQQSYVLALELGLLEGGERDTALDRLESQLRGNGFRPTMDARHGALLLEILALEGRAQLAYQVLLQTAPASWLHPMSAGASILWDTTRDVPGRMAVGAIAGWLQRFLLGLELDPDLTPERNAYRRMRIQPRPALEFAAGPPVRHAAGHFDSVHGRYECAWSISADGFRLRVRVPGNCSARVILPDGFECLVVAGEHEFHTPLDRLDGLARSGFKWPAEPMPLVRQISGGS